MVAASFPTGPVPAAAVVAVAAVVAAAAVGAAAVVVCPGQQVDVLLVGHSSL